MTRKLLFGFIAMLAMSLWVVGCATDDAEEPTPNEPPEFSNVIGIPAPGMELCAPSFTVTGIVEDDSGVAEVILLFDGVELETFDGGDETEVIFTFANVVFPSTGTGHTLTLVADDNDDERTTYTHVLLGAIYQDGTAPVITKTSPAGDIFIVNGQYLEVAVADDGDIVEVCLEIDGIDIGCETQAPFRWDLGIWRDDYAPGNHEVHFTAEDYCGNIGEATYTLDFQFSEYTLTVTTPEVEEIIGCDAPYLFQATDSWAVSELFDVVRVDFLIDDGEQGTYSDFEKEGGIWEYALDVSSFLGGEHQVSARAYFDNGSGQDSENSILWYKSCPPTAVLGFPVVFNGPEFQVMADASQSSDDNLGTKIYHWSSPTEPGVVILPAADTPNPEVMFDFSLGYGTYEICVQVEDIFGMLSDVECVEVTITDVTAPTVWEWIQPDSMAVVGDYTLPMTLEVDATDRLTMPEVAQVEFRYLENANPANFGNLCTDTDIAGGWACDIGTFVNPGGWYTFKAYATDNADPGNVSTSLNHPVWKSDMPVISMVAEEHADGGFYSNVLGPHVFTAVWTDDNFGDGLTTYEVRWDLDGDGVCETVGTGNTITWTAPDYGDYSTLCQVFETPPMGCTPSEIPSMQYLLEICIENDVPLVESFDIDLLHFSVDEGPYCNDWLNPNDPDVPGGVYIVTEDADESDIHFAAMDDDDTEVCVSGCDYFELFFDYAGTTYDVTVGPIDCDDVMYPVDWDNFMAGPWTVTFTIYDRAGNMASASMDVVKSDYPTITTPASFDNFFEGAWQCFVDPLGVPVRFDDWAGDDDNGSWIDSLVFEFNWDYGVNPPSSAIDCYPDMLEEIWDYHGPDYILPWTYYVPDYGHHWVRIWACDMYGQWTVGEWVETGVEDHCDPDWVNDLQICEVEGTSVDPVGTPWDRVDILSGPNIDFCTCVPIVDREDPFDNHGVDQIQFIAFDPNAGWDVDGNGVIEGMELDYWFIHYGYLPIDGSLGDGTSACTGQLAYKNGGNADCTNTTEAWDANTGSWYGCCGFFYVYAIALDENGNYSEPSAPVVIFKYSEPTVEFCDCFVGASGIAVPISAVFTYECGQSIDTIEYEWVFDDGETATTTEPMVEHVFAGPGLYEVEVTVTVVDASGTYTDTATTWVSIDDTDEPLVTNLDIEATTANDNYCNAGWYNAQYGVMNYTVTANDINGILQGPATDGCANIDDWTVEITLWTDADGEGDDGIYDPGTQMLVVDELVNENCMLNEVTWIFDFDWGWNDCSDPAYVDEYARGYYWMAARVRDRSGNYMGQGTPDPTDDYYWLQLFHSEPPVVQVVGDYTNLNTLRFLVDYDQLVLCDELELGPDFKTQWDHSLNNTGYVDCTDWYNGNWAIDHCRSEFDFDLEVDYGNPIYLDYFASGDGYGCYDCDNSTYTNDDDPAAVRAVDEDGIYSETILFDVCIEDVTEPCIEWQDPAPCDVVTGVIDLVVWASDYPEHDYGRDDNDDGYMPCVPRVDFFVNDHYAGTVYNDLDCDNWDGDPADFDGIATMCDVDNSGYWEFRLENFDISAFLDSIYGDPACGWGGVVELEARAYDLDLNQSGDASITVCESNKPQIVESDICDWAYDALTVSVDFTDFICDDNPLDYIVVDWGDGSPFTTVDWANAGAVSHTYASDGCYGIDVQVYDYYSTAGMCCEGGGAGPFLDFTFIGDLLVDLAAPIVLTSGWTPALDEDCVSVDPTDDIEIIVGDITDDDSFACYGEVAIDWVKFWISDDDWTNKEYLGIDTDPDGGWSIFWNPWNQEAKTIWVGVEIADCAGNTAEYFMESPGEYWFNKDLRPWDVLIDQHEVWAINQPGCMIPFEAEAHNDPDDWTDFVWDFDDDGVDDYNSDQDDPMIYLDLDDLGISAGTYDLVVWAVDDCWEFDDDANYDTAVIHVCEYDEGPDVTYTDEFGVPFTPADPAEEAYFDFCLTVDDCFYWTEGIVSIVSSLGDTLYIFDFQTEHQWMPDWDPCYTYEAPNGAETFCFSFPLGNEDCVYVDAFGDTLGYNPFAHGETFEVYHRVWDTEDNLTDDSNYWDVNDVLAPYAPADHFWYGDDYDNTDGDELMLLDAEIPMSYVGPEGIPGNIVVWVDVIDWHCTDIDSVVFVYEEPAATFEQIDADNIFGTDNDGTDGFYAILSLDTPREQAYKVGVFIWDIEGNQSLQQSVTFHVVEDD